MYRCMYGCVSLDDLRVKMHMRAILVSQIEDVKVEGATRKILFEIIKLIL